MIAMWAFLLGVFVGLTYAYAIWGKAMTKELKESRELRAETRKLRQEVRERLADIMARRGY